MLIRRLIGLAVVGWVASMVAGAIAAMSVKRSAGPDDRRQRGRDRPVVAIFGPLAFHSTATQFRGGSWSAGTAAASSIFAMRRWRPTGRRSACGPSSVVAVLVPADWKVISSVRGMGGLTDIRPAKGYAEDAPRAGHRGDPHRRGLRGDVRPRRG